MSHHDRQHFTIEIFAFRAWLNYNAMFNKTLVSMSMKQNLFVSVFVHECLMMLNDVEYATIEMIVT